MAALSLSLSACGNDPETGPQGTGGTGGVAGVGGVGGGGSGGTAGDGGTGGVGGTGGSGGIGGEGGTAGSGGSGGTGGSGGEGGTAGTGGTGGSGGGEPGSCIDDQDCIGFTDVQCLEGRCNNGDFDGPLGFCVAVPAQAGTACEDGLFCTAGDVCNEAGECIGGAENECGLTGSQCNVVVCDEDARECFFDPIEDGTSCKSGDLCAEGICQAGECTGVPKDCSGETTACATGVCNPADGTCVPEARTEGTACTLAGLEQCEVAACDGLGACMPDFREAGTSCYIAGLGSCESAACDGAGTCASSTAPDGSSCDDGFPCTIGDACVSGNCAGTFDAGMCVAAYTYYTEGFEDCDVSGWTFTGTWACGSPTSGPNGARTGTGVIATNLAGNYPDGASVAAHTATSGPIDLSNAVEPVLEFHAWLDTETNYDGVRVSVSRDGGATFEQAFKASPPYQSSINSNNVPAWNGHFGNWTQYRVDLSEYAGETIQLQFSFGSDGSGSNPGMYVDDLQIVDKKTIQPQIAAGATLPVAMVGQEYSSGVPGTWTASNAVWSITGATNAGWLSIDPATGRLSGTPSAADVGPFSVTVRFDEPDFAYSSERDLAGSVSDLGALTYFVDDFETCGAWTLTGEWECGMPTSGPMVANAGAGVLATGIARPYFNSRPFAENVADSPSIDLTQATDAKVRFRVWMDTESGWDGFNLRVSTDDGISFDNLVTAVSPAMGTVDGQAAWTGRMESSGWRDFSADLTSFVGQTIRLRFSFRSDTSGSGQGVYIDSMSIGSMAADPLQIVTSSLPTAKTGRPFTATLQKRGGSPTATWSIVSGTNHSWLTLNPATGVLSGAPTLANVGPGQVVVRVSQPEFPSNFAERTFDFEVVEPPVGELHEETFAACGQWTPTGNWQCGVPTNTGPSECHSPDGCIATNLSGNYADNIAWGTNHITSLPIDLTTAQEPKLSFFAWIQTETCCDGLNLKISRDGGAFVRVDNVSPSYNGTADSQPVWQGMQNTWREYTVDLRNYAGSTIQIRFDFRSDVSNNGPGAYVDDVVITEAYGIPLEILTTTLPTAKTGLAYQATLQKRGGSSAATWSVVSGTNHGWLTFDAATGTFTGTPTAANLGPVQIVVRLAEPSLPTNFAEATYDFEVVEPPVGELFADDFSGCAGWDPTGNWQCGNPSNTGPSACNSPGGCLATNLSGNYADNIAWGTNHITSMPIDLTTAEAPRLSFFAWILTETCCDGVNLKISRDGGEFLRVDAVSPAYNGTADGIPVWQGNLNTWRKHTIDLRSYVGSTIRLRFDFRSDTSSNGPGAYIDDVLITESYGDPLSITTTFLPNGLPGLPWAADLAKGGGSANAVWSLVSGPAWMQIDPTGHLSGTPPALGAVTATVRVEEPRNPGNFAEATFEFQIVEGPTGPYYTADFTPDAEWETQVWELGEPSGGPGSCRSEGSCLAVRLTGSYGSNIAFSSATATSPEIDLSTAFEPRLEFWAWMDTESSWDGFNLKVSMDDGPFALVTNVTPAYTGNVNGPTGAGLNETGWSGQLASSGWRQFRANLSAYSGHVVRLRFAFGSDGSGQHQGVYIDDLTVVSAALEPMIITTANMPSVLPGQNYQFRLTKTGATPFVNWSIVSGTNHEWLTVDPSSGVLAGTPAAGNVGEVTVRVRVEQAGFTSNFTEKDLTFVVESPFGVHYGDRFTVCGEGWTLTAPWECGVPSNVGPAECRSLGGCMGTNLSGNYPDSVNWGTATATTADIDLTAAADPKLTFWAWVRTQSSTTDVFNVKISRDGGAFEVPAAALVSPAYSGTADGQNGWGGDLSPWRQFTIDLSPYVGSVVRARFDFRSDASTNNAGVYIDDLRVSERYLDTLAITSAFLPNGFAGVPWGTTLTKSGGSRAAVWSLPSAPAWMQIDQNGRLVGTPTDLGEVTVTVRVEEPLNAANFAEQTFTVGFFEQPTAPYHTADFSPGGEWVVAGEWELGVPSSGPGSCRSGGSCLATRLVGDYRNEARFSTSTATSPDIDLTQAVETVMSFWVWANTELGWDGFNLKVSVDDGPFQRTDAVSPPYTGVTSATAGEMSWSGDLTAGTWRKYTANLAAYEGHVIKVQFGFGSDSGGTRAGVFIDEVSIATRSLDPLSIAAANLPGILPGEAYQAQLRRSGGTETATWSIVSGMNHEWLVLNPVTGMLSGVATEANAGPVTVRVRVEQPGFPSNFDEKDFTFRVESVGTYFVDWFSGCGGDWTVTGTLWQCGVPSDVGPSECFTLGGCVGTNLAGNYPSSVDWGTQTLESGDIDLTAAIEPRLSFWAWVATESATLDAFNVKISRDGGPFEIPAATRVSPAYTGSAGTSTTGGSQQGWGGELGSLGWRKYTIDVSDYAGSIMRLRFDFRSDTSVVRAGIYLDDIRVSASFNDPLSITTTTLPPGFPNAPWWATLAKIGGTQGSVWSLVNAPAWMQIDPATGMISGVSPSMDSVEVTVRVEEPMNPTNYAEKTFTVGFVAPPAGAYYMADFAPDGEWEVAGEWELGVATSGPGSCLSGGNCLATRLAGNYGLNVPWSTSVATSPEIDLTTAENPVLSFAAWVQTESSWDGFNLKISVDGGPFNLHSDVSPPYGGSVTGSGGAQQGWSGTPTGGTWGRFSVNLASFVGHVIRVQFSFGSDTSNTFPGVYIDDFVVAQPGFSPVRIIAGAIADIPAGYPFERTLSKTGGVFPVWSLIPIANADWLSIDPFTGVLSGTPTAADAGPVSFTVRLEEPAVPSIFSEATFEFEVYDISLLPPGHSYLDDMEDGHSWTLRGDWEYGTPTNVGPAACHSGDNCLGTKLDALHTRDRTDIQQNYSNMGPIYVPPGEPSKLTFWAWLHTYDGANAYFDIQVRSESTSFVIPAPASVDPAPLSTNTTQSLWGGDLSQFGWRKYSVDLSAYPGELIHLALVMYSTGPSTSTMGAGVYIDDIAIETASMMAPSIVEDLLADAYPDVPYTQRMKRTQGPSIVTWSITGGTNHGWLSIDPATGVLTGTPTVAEAGPVSVTVRVEDPADPFRADERELFFVVSEGTVYYSTDFEGACPNGWTLAQDWQCGAPTSGPNAAFGGTKVLATNLAGDYANTRSWSSSHATSPTIDLSTAVAPVAWFRMWLNTEGYQYDGVHLEVSQDGGAFQTVTNVAPGYPIVVSGAPAWGGNHELAGYVLVRANLATSAGHSVRLRFANSNDDSGTRPGAYIDDLIVVEGP